MKRLLPFFLLLFACAAFVQAQEGPLPDGTELPVSTKPSQAKNSQTKKSKKAPAVESSSKQTQVDLRAPSGDVQRHPYSQIPDVYETQRWEPMKALKSVEVGNYYMREKNYKAALSRFCEALLYKPKDAAATFGLGAALEQMGKKPEARKAFEQYLIIAPEGPNSKDVHKGLARLKDVKSSEDDLMETCPTGLLDPPAIKLTGTSVGAEDEVPEGGHRKDGQDSGQSRPPREQN